MLKVLTINRMGMECYYLHVSKLPIDRRVSIYSICYFCPCNWYIYSNKQHHIYKECEWSFHNIVCNWYFLCRHSICERMKKENLRRRKIEIKTKVQFCSNENTYIYFLHHNPLTGETRQFHWLSSLYMPIWRKKQIMLSFFFYVKFSLLFSDETHTWK